MVRGYTVTKTVVGIPLALSFQRQCARSSGALFRPLLVCALPSGGAWDPGYIGRHTQPLITGRSERTAVLQQSVKHACLPIWQWLVVRVSDHERT